MISTELPAKTKYVVVIVGSNEPELGPSSLQSSGILGASASRRTVRQCSSIRTIDATVRCRETAGTSSTSPARLERSECQPVSARRISTVSTNDRNWSVRTADDCAISASRIRRSATSESAVSSAAAAAASGGSQRRSASSDHNSPARDVRRTNDTRLFRVVVLQLLVRSCCIHPCRSVEPTSFDVKLCTIE